jgi:hypothetical protein
MAERSRHRRERIVPLGKQIVTRVGTPEVVAYYQHGGILPYVLRQML